ncbi:distal tail protein Dit [Virgibacillus halodenitrificans]|uniref:distal tail protein Dit n=1 Tax=Virgibacillus halodenitrificans TaxID=1482 RepID=UPI00031EDC12|nr:distal tail protein Dit [Virgibacillus halodenitrificans]
MLYNGVDTSSFMRVIEIRGRGAADQNLSLLRPTGSDEDYVVSRSSPTRYIEVDYEIRGKNRKELRKKIDAFSDLIVTEEKVPIIFGDEPDMTYYCEFAGAEENTERPHIGKHQGTITLLREKHKYGPEKEVILDTTIGNILTNEGTAEAQPIFELEVLAPVTFAMVSNGDEYNLLGIPGDDDMEVVDTKPLVLSERGETLNTWSTSGVVVDDRFNDVDGTMTYDGTGIMADTFGTGTKIHGPAIIKEIPPIQDFEIETIFDTISNFDEDNYRMEVYMFDEGMNMLGKIGLNDNNRNFTRRIGLARVGEYAGAGVRYAINGSNYKRDDLQRVALMYLRVRREGQKYTFYISEIRNGKHYATITETFNDVNNEYQGKLKYVQLFIGNWQDRRRTFRTRINSVNVYELKQETIDQTPYIAGVGDIITFDHVNDELLINGEDRKEIKDFGGSFFSLAKGENQLAVLPSGAFNAKVKYRPRYR